MSEFYPNGSGPSAARSLFDLIPEETAEVFIPDLGYGDPSICPDCLGTLRFSTEGHSYCPDCEM